MGICLRFLPLGEVTAVTCASAVRAPTGLLVDVDATYVVVLSVGTDRTVRICGSVNARNRIGCDRRSPRSNEGVRIVRFHDSNERGGTNRLTKGARTGRGAPARDTRRRQITRLRTHVGSRRTRTGTRHYRSLHGGLAGLGINNHVCRVSDGNGHRCLSNHRVRLGHRHMRRTVARCYGNSAAWS